MAKAPSTDGLEVKAQKAADGSSQNGGQMVVVVYHPDYALGEEYFKKLVERKPTVTAEGSKLVIKG